MQIALGALQAGDEIKRPGWNTTLEIEKVIRETVTHTTFTKEITEGVSISDSSYAFVVHEKETDLEYVIDLNEKILIINNDGATRQVEQLPSHVEKVN